jgi:hypothetical protein
MKCMCQTRIEVKFNLPQPFRYYIYIQILRQTVNDFTCNVCNAARIYYVVLDWP